MLSLSEGTEIFEFWNNYDDNLNWERRWRY
jgi:hypothetical protein